MSTHLHKSTLHGYTHLSKNLKPRIQVSQNKFIHFCLQLDKMTGISKKGFGKIKGLPLKERCDQCINSIVFKYFDNQCPHYLNEVFKNAAESSLSLRKSYKNSA